ncbi:MAG: hypothetical protein H7Y02_11050 [Candidatus Obscuribacterales bacterium]|nr:hypothetical protein [Steroidobacteraceae bacterium]
MNTQTLPSRRKLLISTAVAIVIAALLLVSIVLPAEYGVDPLRVGKLLGLVGMSAEGAPSQVSAEVMHAHPRKYFTGHVEIEVKPKEELEYKATLAKGEPLVYSWAVQGGEVYFEFHGEPTEGEWPKDFYQSYEIQERSEAAHGSFIAPFTGRHGWYWRNLSDQPLTIVLDAAGYYSSIEKVGSSSPDL